MNEAFIVAALRTAGGRRGGRLSGWHAADLAGKVLDALVDQAGADPGEIDDVVLGCVSQTGEQSTNIARNAVLASSLPESVPATSVDRQCGSSQQALHFAAQAVMSGTMDIVIAAGVESMSRVPMGITASLPEKNGFGTYMSPKMQARYPNVVFSQFTGAEMLARKYDLPKERLDEFGFASQSKAIAASRADRFRDEILPIEITMPDGGRQMHTADEGIRVDATLEGTRAVKLIHEGGRLTAATSSQICDGASGVMVVNERGLRRLGLQPLARIHHLSVLGHDPVIMLEAPIPATQRALRKAGMSIDDIDLYEVNQHSPPCRSPGWIRPVPIRPASISTVERSRSGTHSAVPGPG